MKRSPAPVVQARVIFAVIMREITIRYGRQRLGYLWAVIEPLIYILSILAFFHFMNRKIVSGLPLVPFVVSALLPFITFRNTAIRVMSSSHNNRAILAYPQIKVFDIFIARTLLEVATSLSVCAIIVGFSVASGLSEIPDNVLGVMSSILLAAFCGLCLGSLLNSISQYTTVVEKMIPPVLRVLVLITGLFYTADELHQHVREWLLLNPIFHIIEYSRESYFDRLNDYADIMYVLYCFVPIFLLGLVTERSASRQLTME